MRNKNTTIKQIKTKKKKKKKTKIGEKQKKKEKNEDLVIFGWHNNQITLLKGTPQA